MKQWHHPDALAILVDMADESPKHRFTYFASAIGATILLMAVSTLSGLPVLEALILPEPWYALIGVIAIGAFLLAALTESPRGVFMKHSFWNPVTVFFLGASLCGIIGTGGFWALVPCIPLGALWLRVLSKA
jgi:hypothetical protein